MMQTISFFTEEQISQVPLSEQEIRIINCMSSYYHETDNLSKATEILKNLKNSIKKYSIDITLKASTCLS